MLRKLRLIDSASSSSSVRLSKNFANLLERQRNSISKLSIGAIPCQIVRDIAPEIGRALHMILAARNDR